MRWTENLTHVLRDVAYLHTCILLGFFFFTVLLGIFLCALVFIALRFFIVLLEILLEYSQVCLKLALKNTWEVYLELL